MLQPKKAKYRKEFRGKMRGMSGAGKGVTFGEYGLQALEPAWLSAKQIEAARKTIANYTKRKAKYWIRVFPNKPVTKKPAEVRMGKGKGGVEEHVCVVKPGRMIFEVAGVDETTSKEALRRAADKLPFKTRILDKSSLF